MVDQQVDGRSSRGFIHRSARDSLSPKGYESFADVYEYRKYAEWVERSEVAEAEQAKQSVWKEQAIDITSRKNDEDVVLSHNDNTNNDNNSNKSLADTTNDPKTPAATMQALPRCSPAKTRPFKLHLDDSRGATSVSPAELRQVIKQTTNGRTAISSRPQIIQHTSLPTPLPSRGRKKYSPQGALTEATVFAIRQRPMGNQQSTSSSSYGSQHILAATASSEEDSSLGSIVHYPTRNKENVKRGNIAVLKKKSGRDQKFTTTIIEVPRAATAPNLDLVDDDNDDGEAAWEDEQQEERKIRHVKTLSAPSPALPDQPGSPATITEESAARPLSAGTTVTGWSVDEEDTSPLPPRVSALSPTIPTPSPIPEDSPHQYGLKDFAAYSITPTPPPDLSVAKRRSSGIDIFNEAKNLQTASSFLNGLSNARRRAESRAQQRSSTAETRLTSASTGHLPCLRSSSTIQSGYKSLTHLPLRDSPSPDSSILRPLTPKLDDLSRTLGHTHKSSGFAYAKPLSIIQMKCYRNHERLLRSGNKYYQVECAVCHRDEPSNYYWTCSWCALRMCEDCRGGFRKHGLKALKEKVRDAEFGAAY